MSPALFRHCLLTLALLPGALLAQDDNPFLVTAEDRCGFQRVDDASLALAIDRCTEAAQLGDSQAQYELGDFYYQGKRIEQDFDRALAWLEEASLQGHPTAQYRLGLMHYQGEGVTRNLAQAFIILKMSAVNGEDAAMDASDRIALQMNEEELQIATQLLSSLFRNYLQQMREEQLQGSEPPRD